MYACTCGPCFKKILRALPLIMNDWPPNLRAIFLRRMIRALRFSSRIANGGQVSKGKVCTVYGGRGQCKKRPVKLIFCIIYARKIYVYVSHISLAIAQSNRTYIIRYRDIFKYNLSVRVRVHFLALYLGACVMCRNKF